MLFLRKRKARIKAKALEMDARYYVFINLKPEPYAGVQFSIADEEQPETTKSQPKYSLGPKKDPLQQEIEDWIRSRQPKKPDAGKASAEGDKLDGVWLDYHEWERKNKKQESFSAIVLRRIDEMGMEPKTFYRQAGMDRKLFSKLKTDYCYQPNKKTAIQCCLALKMNRKEAEELLKCAGYALAESSSFDLAIRYCIERNIFDLLEVNALLEALEEPLL